MKKGMKITLGAVAVLLVVCIMGGCFFTTQQNEYSIVRQFGKVVRIVDTPGLSVKLPFIQTVSTLPQTEMLYDLAVSDVITSDKKSMVADSFVLWRISDPLKFIQTLSGSIANAEYRHGRLQQPQDRDKLHEAGGGHLRARRRARREDNGERRHDV